MGSTGNTPLLGLEDTYQSVENWVSLGLG